MQTTAAPTRAPWLMLISRTVMFFLVQALIAFVLFIAGTADAWNESSRYWTWLALGGNIGSVFLLNRVFQLEGKRYLDLFRFERATFWKDLGLALGGFILAGPIGYLPMIGFANLFLGSNDTATAMLFKPLPLWAILIGFLFPITIAFAELPTYFGYVMPRLEKQLKSGWLAWGIASLFLGLQHATLPLILNGNFILWRALMYLPFALYIGLVIKLRPRLLPFMVIAHALIDLSAVAVYFTL